MVRLGGCSSEEFSDKEIVAEINRSLYPTLWCCNVAIKLMKRRGCGTIVNVSSVATTGILRGPYSAAKGGVNALTRSLAMECAQFGIRVNATAPGGTDVGTRLIPRDQQDQNLVDPRRDMWSRQVIDQTISSSYFKRISSVSEQAAPILFLASDEASYLTNVVLTVGGGDNG